MRGRVFCVTVPGEGALAVGCRAVRAARRARLSVAAHERSFLASVSFAGRLSRCMSLSESIACSYRSTLRAS